MANIHNTLNWANEKQRNEDSAISSIKKVKKTEAKRIKEGWRWVNVNAKTKIFVPCDEEGNPTEDALRRIERAKNPIVYPTL